MNETRYACGPASGDQFAQPGPMGRVEVVGRTVLKRTRTIHDGSSAFEQNRPFDPAGAPDIGRLPDDSGLAQRVSLDMPRYLDQTETARRR